MSLLYFVYAYFTGIESGFEWQKELSIENKSAQIDLFKSKLFEIPVMAENFVILQYFKPVFTGHTSYSSYYFLFISAFSFCLGLSVITTYKKLIWFIPGTALVAGWLASFKMDLLAVFGFENNVTVSVMLVTYLGLAYLFHSIIRKVSFLKRFLTFVLATVFFALIIQFGSEHAKPFVHLANYGLIIPGIITLLFLMITGYEVLQIGLSTITFSKSSNPWSIPLNFLIITVLYIGNLIIYYLYTDGSIDWKVAYNIYLFFPVCAILGIWSHRKRSVLYQDILPFAPGGAFLYMTFALVSIVTIGYVLSISLTPAIQLFEHFFVGTQIAFGLAFFVYGARNFYKPMVHNMPVFKMIYDPRMLPHYIMRGLALAFLMFFVGKKLYTIKSQIYSSHHSLVADSYLSNDEVNLADYNYKKSLKLFNGVHASYRQTLLYFNNGKIQAGCDILNSMRDEHKSDLTYGILSSSLKDNSEEILTHFVLGDAIKKFPDSPYLGNNLGLSFYKLGDLDSAIFYLSKNPDSEMKSTQESNVLGIATLSDLEGLSELELNDELKEDIAYQANAFALSNVSKTPVTNPDLMTLDTVLSAVELSYLNNFVNANIGHVPAKVISALENHLEATSEYFDPNKNNARIALSKALFFNGSVNEGFTVAKDVAKIAPDVQVPYYSNFAGLLALRMGDPVNGHKYIGVANEMLQLVPENFARLNHGISSLEVGDTASATNAFIALSYLKPEKKKEYKAIYESLGGDYTSSDMHRASYLLYHPEAFASNYEKILNDISNPDLKLISATYLLEYALDKNDLSAVEKLWAYIPEGINDSFFFKKLNLLNLRSTLKAKNFKALEDNLDLLTIDELDSRWKAYFKAQVSQYETNDTTLTKKYYQEAIKEFPKREEVWLEFISFLKSQENYDMAYDLSAEFLRKNEDTEQMLLNYVDLAIKIGLVDVAKEGVLELESVMSNADYLKFKESFDAKVEALYKFEDE